MADRRVSVNLDADVSAFVRGMLTASAASDTLGKKLKANEPILTRQDKLLDRNSGRLRLMGEAALTLGPAFIPLGAAVIPALAGLTAGLGAAAAGAGVAVMAFQGVGDALKSLDAYQLEPTTANLEKMQAALDNLGPAGADFARFLDSLDPALGRIQDAAREGLFPGLQEGIESLMPMLPQVEAVVSHIATTLGNLGADAGKSLSGDGFRDFFDYLETDAAPTLDAFGRTIGNVAEGLGSLVVAFAPISRDFTSGMESMSRSFADWAAGLSKTQGFRDFVNYVQTSGPQALDALGSIATALAAVVKAAAPFGQAVLPALTALADVIAAIAGSPVGPALFTAAAGFLAVSRASTLAAAGMAKFNASAAATGKLGIATKVAGIAAAFGILGNEFAKLNGSKIDLSELDRNLSAIASGGGTDALDHLSSSLKMLSDTMPDAYEIPTLGGIFGDTPKDNAAEYVESYDQALAAMVQSGNAEKAAKIFAQIQEARTGLSAQTHQFAPFGESAKEFDSYAAALSSASAATNDYADADRAAAEAARKSRTEIRGLVSAMEEQRTAALASFDAVTQYAQALIDARKQAEKSSLGIEITNDLTRKQKLEVIENRSALDRLAAAWNNQGKAVGNSMSKWQSARADFIATARQMGATGAEARKLADDVLDIPKQRVIDIKLYGSEQAASQIERIRAAVTSIPREWSTTYYVNQVNSISKRFTPGVLPGEADGGTIPKDGKHYADRYLYMLAPGEEVISNRHGQADQFRADRAAGRIPGYADGGTAGKYAKAIRSADRGFDLTGAMTTREVRAALREFAHQIHEAGGDLGKSFEHLGDRAVKLSDRYDDAQNKLTRLRDLGATVKGSFNHDAFGGSLFDFNTQTDADANDANAMNKALSKAGRKGLNGPLFEALAASGNLLLAQQFAALSKGQIGAEERKYGTRAAAQNNLSHTVVTIAGMPETQRAIHRMAQQIEKLEQRIEDGVYRGARAGTAQHEKEKNRNTAALARAGR